MKSLIVENVRCFEGRKTIPIAPLTLLVGGNSTGKSTFLAAVRLASQLTRPSVTLDFNEEPFSLGSFDQIANHYGDGLGRASSFGLGLEMDIPESVGVKSVGGGLPRLRLFGEFVNWDSQPFLRTWSVSCDQAFEFSLARTQDNPQVVLTIRTPSVQDVVVSFPVSAFPAELIMEPGFVQVLLSGGVSEQMGVKIEGRNPSQAELKVIRDLLSYVRTALRSRIFASAPIRSEPHRTYEPLKDISRPSGGHIPMVLAKMAGESEWERIDAMLREFGLASGLFDSIEVNRFGQQESSPFQIFVKIHGGGSNLVDVGYGVSQVLPIVIDIMQSPRDSMSLLQQPAAHLCPRAQAEIGSLFGRLVKTDGKRFVVETHSSHLVDRVRMDVRNKKLNPEDVMVLFFHHVKSKVEIVPMPVDQGGNFVQTSDEYRRFFLGE